MAYDYSSESRALELPNPYRVQNFMLFIGAVVLVAGGVLGLAWARQLLERSSLVSVMPLAVGAGLIASGIAAAGAAARRLRFFFGRGRPHSLAKDIPPGVTGTSALATPFKELLRQGALEYPEPRGALNGLLYHLVPRLITAPRQVQRKTQAQFLNVLAISVTLLSFMLSWWVFGTERSRPWLSAVYFLFGLFFLLRPLIRRDAAQLGVPWLVLLIAVPIVGPVLAGLAAARLPLPFDLELQTSVMLLAALVAVVLAMFAMLAQVDAPPATQTSCEQQTLSMNAPPSALMDELERYLQSQWTEKIPNRRYSRLLPAPDLSQRAGPFTGELFEESQPMPSSGAAAPTLGSALSHSRHRWLVLLDFWGLMLLVAATACALVFIHQFGAVASGRQALQLAVAGVSMILALVALFCFSAAAEVWGRFNFESVLTWVEMLGTWQTSRIGTGNQLTARLNTESEIVRTESMTLRVWRSRIESVVFGKDGERQVTAMFGMASEARALATHLIDFARRQSVLVTPESSEDRRRMASLGLGEAQLNAASGGAAPELPGAFRGRAAIAGAVPTMKRYCTHCGAEAAAGARFCAACGKPIEQPAAAG